MLTKAGDNFSVGKIPITGKHKIGWNHVTDVES